MPMARVTSSLRERGLSRRTPGTGARLLGLVLTPTIDLMDDERERALVDMVIRIGHVLGIDVVAEGAEREDQLDTLRELVCHLVQGYLLGRPLPPSEFDATKAAPSVTTATSWRSATSAAAG